MKEAERIGDLSREEEDPRKRRREKIAEKLEKEMRILIFKEREKKERASWRSSKPRPCLVLLIFFLFQL